MNHPDLDALCDVLAGEAPDDAEHVSTCEQCRAQLVALEGAQAAVTAALGSLGDPPMPASLVARLDAALAAERVPKVATATVTPLGAAPSRRTPWLPWVGGLAAACALVLGFLTLRPGPSGSQDTTATRAESQPQLTTSSTGNSYSAKGDLLAKALPTLLAGSAVKAAAPPVVGAPAAGGTTGGTAPRTQAVTDPLGPLRDQATLAACLAGLADPTDTSLPLALDYAAFDGQPALVVVYPTTKPGKVDVFVVGAGCTQADSKLLFFTRLAKP